MLSYDQLAHFADHGWVVLEDVLDADQCAAYKDALDRCVRTRRPIQANKSADTTQIDNPVLYETSFWSGSPCRASWRQTGN